MDNNINSALLLSILKKIKSNNIDNAQYVTGLCTQVGFYCRSSTFSSLCGLMHQMFRTWPYYSGFDGYPIQISFDNGLCVISPKEQYDAVANSNPFYFAEYIELRKDLLNHMIKELEAVCDEQENKPNKIKVIIDRPSMLAPGEHKANIIGTCITNGLLTITIQVNPNGN